MSALRTFITFVALMALIYSPLGCGVEAGDIDGPQGQSDVTTPIGDVAGDVPQGPDTSPPPDTDAPTPCTTAEDCAAISVGVCQVVVCDVSVGACVVGNDKNYTPCNDEDACTADEVCFDGACTRGVQRSCDDGNPCTNDTCDPAQGCLFDANEEPCSDGNACTTDDTCQDGACTGVETDGCGCATDADCEAFDDADLCNGTVRCVDGSCAVDPGSVVTCVESDDNVCTQMVCSPDTGTCDLNLLSELPCSDGNTCTEGDTCTDGVCEGTVAPCECEADSDCAIYDDEDLCNGVLACVDGQCATDFDTVVICPAMENSPCETMGCDPGTGECTTKAVPDGTACHDSNVCTEGDHCEAGVCVSTPVLCDDGNGCTDDACDEASQGCVFINNTADCDDADACTAGDACSDGACSPGEPVLCDDSDACTVDGCDPVLGCAFEAMDCDDGDDCTVDDCTDGACTHGLDDTNPACVACTGDAACDDGDPCTDDACDLATGVCVHVTKDCDDANPCTDDTCDGAAGCLSTPVDGGACDDDNACTLADSCVAGACVGVPDPACGACGDGTCDGGETCATCASDCGGCEGGCCESNGSAGCDDAAVTACVCAVDDLCCAGTWDAACAETAVEQCGLACAAPCGDGACTETESCLTCAEDCGACAAEACCAPHDTPGCEDAAVSDCACAADDYCCLFDWDEFCVEEAILSCGLSCAACGDGECGAAEDCATCPLDCGACATCGDGACGAGENCGTCEADCGVCSDGECCEANGTPGCEDAATTACVCAEDALCCDVGWDPLCVAIAVETCGFDGACPGECGDGTCDPNEDCLDCAADCGECAACGDGLCDADENCASCPSDCGDCEGACCEPNGTVGCGDLETSLCVCDLVDPWCCEVEWDDLCVEAAKQTCGACVVEPPTGPCCEAHGGFGCDDPDVAACVCADEPFCCDGQWDMFCAEAAGACGADCADACGDGACGEDETCASCAADCGACEGACCAGHPGVGCADAATSACVCDIDASCCENQWTDDCAIQAVIQCGWTDDCAMECGDGACTLGETCDSCSADCGVCGDCGDAECGPAETCQNCPSDCGACDGDCCKGNGSGGCDDPAVTDCVCDEDAWCCALAWDDLCAETASKDCGACESEGDCCEPHEGAGCEEPAVEACVCDIAPFCCSGEWDIICAALAVQDCGADCEAEDTCGDGQCTGAETCGTCYPDCGACEGDCCGANDTPGCFDPLVTSCVCLQDDVCCEDQWDDMCVLWADTVCSMDCDAEYCGNGVCDGADTCESCPGDCGACATNACCEASEDGSGGCADAAVESCVCGMLAECCDDAFGWDAQCAGLAETMCGAECAPAAGSCCDDHEGLGCDDAATAECVCAADPDCCDIAWDDLCVEEAVLCGGCAASGPCCEAHGGIGCDDANIESCVCDNPDWDDCCWFTWDADCVAAAESAECGGCSQEPSSNGCCEASEDGSAGCEEPDVVACVCAIADYCCSDAWDGLCAGVAVEECNAGCGEVEPCGDGVCEPPVGSTHQIDIFADGFTPADLEVEVGDSVTWVNKDTADHTASSMSGPVPFNIVVFAGQQGNVLFTFEGTYDYIDFYYPANGGTITVVPATTGESCETCPADCGGCGGDGDCCVATDGIPGCGDAAIEACVCEADPVCCADEWDPLCVDEATLCGGCGGPP